MSELRSSSKKQKKTERERERVMKKEQNEA
jgi:hypothetical protein